MSYRAPVSDMQFVMKELAGLDEVAALPGCEDVSADLADAILEEAAKFAGSVLAPLNWTGDQQGARWHEGEVTTAEGWKSAYQQFAESGWTALACNPEHGGQGLPRILSAPVGEMWKSANLAFSLCPMLTMGAIEALELCGSDELKAIYLDKMVSGEWTGTMNLTEPNAGSDLASVRTKAEPHADGSYRITGQKIFITYGEHDLTPNIIHLVLARLPDAPEGVKGISLFVVPKFLPNADGTPGTRNDVRCVSIEHKLGIHASPTCVLAFGDQGGATGYLVGEANRGLEYMFIMMNAARFAVGQEGIAIAERAYQKALSYARERIQGAEAGVKSSNPGGGKVAIIRHPDVRRMLMVMKSQIEAMRAVALVVAGAGDIAQRHPDEKTRQSKQAFFDLMIPVVKGWSTETGIEVASLGVQVHGGMGYIEETGAAQYLRDARITTIYEGTTGIQANDLIGRKLAREQGVTLMAVIGEMQAVLAQPQQQSQAQQNNNLQAIHAQLQPAVAALAKAGEYIARNYATDLKNVLVGAVPFLRLFGMVAGGWQLARAALVSANRLASGEAEAGLGAKFYEAKIVTARFYAEHILTAAPGLAATVQMGGAALMLTDDQFE